MPNPFDQFDEPGTTATATANPFDQFDTSPQADPRAARRADLQAQQAAARSAGETTSFSARAAAGIEQGLRTPEAMVRGGLDALQYYRALDAVTGSGNRFQRQNEAELRAMRDRDAFLARETQAIEGRDERNFVGDLVQGVARGVVELPPQLMAGAAGAMRGAAVQASAAMGGLQGGLSQFAQERGEGRSQLEALPPAVASGLITAVTTRAFGDTGIESVFRNEGTQGFRRRLLGVLKDAGMEGAEEFVDQAQQDLLERVTRNPGKPLGESFYDTMQALAVGTVIGGAATAPRLIQRGNRPVIVNEQTGTTDFPPLDVDELPAPPVAAPAPNLDPNPAPQTISPATPPTAAAPAPTAEVAPPALSAPAAPTLNPTPNPDPISSSLTLEPVADVPDVPGVPPPLEGQPYDTALRTRPEATMETRPAAPLGLQREPTVSPELADAIAAVRGGYNPEVEAQVSPTPTPTLNPNPAPASSLPSALPSSADLDQVFYSGQRYGKLEPGREGLIFASSDADYARQYVDPLGAGKGAFYSMRIRVKRPKVYQIENEQEFNEFTQRGVTRAALLAEGYDSAVLLDGGKVADVALTSLDQIISPATETTAPTVPTAGSPPLEEIGDRPGDSLIQRYEAHPLTPLLRKVTGAAGAIGPNDEFATYQLYPDEFRRFKADAEAAGWSMVKHEVQKGGAKKEAGVFAKKPTPPDQSGGPTELTPPAKGKRKAKAKPAEVQPTPLPAPSIAEAIDFAERERDAGKSQLSVARFLADHGMSDRDATGIASQVFAEGKTKPAEVRPAEPGEQPKPADIEHQRAEVGAKLGEVKREIERLTKAREAKLKKMGAMVPPPIRLEVAQKSAEAIEKLMAERDRLDSEWHRLNALETKPAEVRPAEPGEQPQPPAQAAPAMQGGMDNLRFTSDPVAKGKGGAPDAKDAKAKLIAELEKAVDQAKPATKEQTALLDKGPSVPRRGQDSRYMGKFGDRNYAEDVSRLRADWEAQAVASGLRKVTIEIPGDGTFTVWNTKENLTELLKRAKRLETSTKPPKGFTETGVAKEDRQWVEQMQAAQGKPLRLWEVRYRDWNNNNLTTTVEARTEFEAEDKVGNEVRGAQTILPGTKYVGEAGSSQARKTALSSAYDTASRLAAAHGNATVEHAKHVEEVVRPLETQIRKLQADTARLAGEAARTKKTYRGKRLTQKQFLSENGFATVEEANARYQELNSAWAKAEQDLIEAKAKEKDLLEAREKIGKDWSRQMTRVKELEGQANPPAVDSAIAALESAKVKPGGLYSLPDLGLTVTLWNGTLTAAQLALRAGRSLAQAVQAGVDWLRAQGQAFDEAQVRQALEQALLQAPGIREHVGKRLLQEDFSPAAKAALEPLLRYEVKPDAQLFAEAAAVVEAIGPMEAEANYFGNPWGLPADAHVVLGFAIGNGLSTLEAQARAAGDTALADRIGRQNAEFQSQFVLQSTETARTLRAYRYFDLVGNLSPFTADLFARKVIEQASQKQKQRIKPALDKGPDGEPGLTDRLNEINRAGINEAARTPEVQGAARTAINQAIEAEAERKDTAVQKAITLEVSNTLETLPSVVRKANAAVLGAWDKLSAGEQVRQQTGRAGQGLENSLWSAVKQRGGTISTVSSVIAQVNRALHEQVNRALGITPQQFVNPTTYLMRLRDALGNAEVMSRIWEQTRAAVGANLAAIGEMERLLVRIESEIAELEAEAKTPLAGGPEVTAKDAKLKAQQQAARDEMLKGRNASLADAIKQRRDRIADVTAQLAEYRKMQPAWQAVMGMTVDVWGPNLLRGLLREQMKADGFRLRKAVADHFRGLAGAPDPLQSLGVLRDKLIAASGLDPQAAERLAKDLEAEYTAQVNKERARLAERLAKARELAKAKAAEREAKRPQLDAESLIDAYERRQTEWLKPIGRKSAVRAIVRQALREGAAVAGLNEQVVRGGVQAQLEAVGVPREAAYRLAYEVWQERQAKGGGIDAVVAARVKELQLDLGRIIRQHWTQVDKAGESLAEHIVGETKMPAEQAERLAAAIQRRFKALVQARKEQALRNLAKTPAARELQKPSVAQRIIEATNLGALDSEGLWQAVADKLGLPTYTAEASAEVKRLAERAQQLPEGSVQRQEATARLMRFIARQKHVNLGDLGWAFWYANTLSGPITHAVNAFSNVLSLAGNVSTQFRDVRGIPQILAATAKGFRTGLTEARAIVKQGPGANRTKFTEQGQALENLDPQDFTGAGLVSQWRYVARALAASDAAFYFPAREAKAITLARALARQEGKTGAAIRTRAQQILDGTEEQQNLWGAQVDRERAQLVAMGEKPDALWTTRRLEQLREQGWGADIGEAADDFALRTTYNNRPYGLIGTLADVAKFAQNRVPGARAVVPFVNVVANMVNDSINYSPWGFARAYAAGRTGEPSVTLSLPFEWAEKLREGKSPMTPDAVVDLHAKAALGTAMLGSLMALALANLDDDDGENFQIYGSGPKDAAARAALRETGWLPYSGRVNGKYVSFANTPLAIPLGALGHYLDAARYDKRFEQADAFNRLGVALWGGAHIITQQSFIDGLARLLGALEERRGRIDTASDRAVEQAFRSISSVAVPNALRQLDRLFDPTIYDTRGIEGALVAGIPFARRAGSPALNAFGEPITNEPWKRFASDAEANVWTDLARRKIYPSVADKAKNAAGREMTDDEHYRYVQESGQAIKRRLETPGMRQMIRSGKEEDARKAVTAIVREERERARRRLGF